MSGRKKAIVASGHRLVSKAAAEILKAGGNAFDAVVGAGFVSTVVEPALTSLGGGGFALTHESRTNSDIFFDFFVDTPGKGMSAPSGVLDFFPVTVEFSGSHQDFNVGLGSVAVPGTLKGLFHLHRRLGIMPLKDILTPAIEFAKGHTLNQQQAHFLKLLNPIMTLTSQGKELYVEDGCYVQEGDTLRNPFLASFLESLLHDGENEFYRGELAKKITGEMQEQHGLLTYDDLAEFKVFERKPFSLPLSKYTFLTAPAPSMGGALIGLSLSLLDRSADNDVLWGSKAYIEQTASMMQEVERLKDLGINDPQRVLQYLDKDKIGVESLTKSRQFSRGTTHISIADKDGNCAAMTCSNGEGSGYFAPGTGVMLNNMMGEDDLHPDGFHSSPAGIRVHSMMSPSILLEDGKAKLVIGSGGSKRIRTAISQVVGQIIYHDRDLKQAVDAPRLYWDGSVLQVEPGFDQESFHDLKERYPVNFWEQRDVYFGGVHAVIPGEEGAGDPRRGGAVTIVE